MKGAFAAVIAMTFWASSASSQISVSSPCRPFSCPPLLTRDPCPAGFSLCFEGKPALVDSKVGCMIPMGGVLMLRGLRGGGKRQRSRKDGEGKEGREEEVDQEQHDREVTWEEDNQGEAERVTLAEEARKASEEFRRALQKGLGAARGVASAPPEHAEEELGHPPDEGEQGVGGGGGGRTKADPLHTVGDRSREGEGEGGGRDHPGRGASSGQAHKDEHRGRREQRDGPMNGTWGVGRGGGGEKHQAKGKVGLQKTSKDSIRAKVAKMNEKYGVKASIPHMPLPPTIPLAPTPPQLSSPLLPPPHTHIHVAPRVSSLAKRTSPDPPRDSSSFDPRLCFCAGPVGQPPALTLHPPSVQVEKGINIGMLAAASAAQVDNGAALRASTREKEDIEARMKEIKQTVKCRHE